MGFVQAITECSIYAAVTISIFCDVRNFEKHKLFLFLCQLKKHRINHKIQSIDQNFISTEKALKYSFWMSVFLRVIEILS